MRDKVPTVVRDKIPSIELRRLGMEGVVEVITLRDKIKIPTVELRKRLGIEGVVEVMRWGRLRWFGQVERKEADDWVSACRNLKVASSRSRTGQG